MTMLVYANALTLEGSEAFDTAGRTIHGWLSNQLGFKPAYGELFRPNQWESCKARRNAWLRSYAATGVDTPEMYAWLLKHADDAVRGRQWITEIGLKREGKIVEFSCAVQTDELSVLVTSSVTASRPRLLRYLLDNLMEDSEARLAPDVPGKSLRSVGNNTDEYRALLASIEDERRDYPLVLVSPDRSGNYMVNPLHLQESLIGLAQVVRISEDFNSYEMEEVLGRNYSAWDGCLNLIGVLRNRDKAFGRLLLSDELESWGDTQHSRVAKVLAHVTHQTNVPRQRQIIRSSDVVRTALRRRLDAQRRKLREQAANPDEDMILLLEQGLDELTSENDDLKNQLGNEELRALQLQDEKSELEQELRTEKYRNRANLRMQSLAGQTSNIDATLFLDFITKSDKPTPEDCLKLISTSFPQRVAILDSAFDSATKRPHFDQGRQLLDLLRLLCTDFIDEMQKGGDDIARKVFTDKQYAAKESKSTQSNKAMRQARTFKYNGTDIVMWRHLKIGVADDVRKSIRVYFEWLPNIKKVVIGHCGEHLPIISH